TYLAIRIGVTDLPPMLFAGLRWIFSGTVFLIFLLLRGYKLPKPADIKHIAVVGLALLGVGNGLVVVGEQWIPSGIAALLIATLPFWVTGLEAAVPSSPRVSKTTISGIIIGLVGVLLIFRSELENLTNPDYLLGMLLVLVAVTSWASGSLYSKYKKVDVHPLMNATFQMLIAGSVQVFIGLVLGEHTDFNFTTNSLYAFFYLAIVGSIAGYAFYIYAINHLPVSLVTTYAYINPILALILGWFVLDEKLDLSIAFAGSIVLAAVYLVRRGTLKS
ncbi:MAG: EamA family transporter, partial [Melioribacteraceae bacterium]|nr:EamA family transporter [Melioribacteraceae bacterium]